MPDATAHALPLARLLHHTADAVAAVRAGQSLTQALTRCPAPARPGTQALSYAVMRRLGAASVVIKELVGKPPQARVDALLHTAVALLWPADDPPYAEHTLVDQAVKAVRQFAPSAAGLVNAVLRRFLRERERLVEAAQAQPEGAFNHPAWWIKRLQRDWPDHWQAILEAANAHPVMTLRVNARRSTTQAYLQRLTDAGLAAHAIGPQALALVRPCPVEALPGFAQGDVSVQDLAAQMAAALLLGEGLPAGARVLDACAAPGGKTAHLLELADLDLLALDVDAERLERVAETLVRLHVRAELRCADAQAVSQWWDGRPFDAVLLDAPCTASGISARHPDARWLRQASDPDRLAQRQLQMLHALWPTLRPGGRLVFATCSVFRAEGQSVIDAFLQQQPPGAARLDPASPGHLLPITDNSGESSPRDGFFYALLLKS